MENKHEEKKDLEQNDLLKNKVNRNFKKSKTLKAKKILVLKHLKEITEEELSSINSDFSHINVSNTNIDFEK